MAKNNDPNTLMLNIDGDSSGLKKELLELQKSVAQSMKNVQKAVKTIGEDRVSGKSFDKINKMFNKSIQGRVEALKYFEKQNAKVMTNLQRASLVGDFKGVEKARVELSRLQAQYKDLRRTLNRGSKNQEAALNAEAQWKDAQAKLKEYEAQNKEATLKAEAQLKQFEDSLQPISKQEKKIQQFKTKLAEAEEEFIRMTKAGKDTKNAESSIKSLKKQIDKLEKSGKSSDGVFKKLWGRIRNVSIYRSIRTLLKAITQGFEEGINNFVQFDESANATMSNINGSLQQIRNTMGIAMVSALQALEPIIVSVSNALVNLLDAFNLAMAKMAGKTTYNKAIKNVDDYAASVDKAKGSLADFDKFRTLDAEQTDPTEMFSEEKIDENESRLSDFFGSVINFIKQIWETISTVWKDLTDLGIWDILLDVFAKIANIIAGVVKLIGGILKGLKDMGALKPILYGLIAAWVAYKVAAMAAAAANATVWMMAHPIAGTLAITAAVASLAGIISSLNSTINSNIPLGSGFATVGLADGGFTTANFIATNENGVREWVGSNGSATAVVNDTQMSDIMYQAVKDGCYEGVVDALSDANSYSATNNDNSVATVEIQGETLFTIVRNVAQKQGLKFSRV